MKIRSIPNLLVCLLFISCNSNKRDEVLIKKLLEKESATWRSGDSKAHAACWQIQPYSKILVSTADGVTIDIPPMSIIAPIKKSTGGTSKNTNYKIKIDNQTAWVSHNEESTDEKGIKTYSYEIRMLEKINGQWKLVGQSIHAFHKK